MDKRLLENLMKGVINGDKQSFDKLFMSMYDALLRFSMLYTTSLQPSEEIVNDVFVKLWINREELNDIKNPLAYLYTSVKNTSLNYLRSTKNNIISTDVMNVNNKFTQNHSEEKELEMVIRNAINHLPKQRRIIFLLIKEENLKALQVAEILNLSIRTVENQVYKAVKQIAGELSIYLGYNPQIPGSKRKNFLSLLLC